ncbi:hypothetical protein L1049_004582 [Liquidambar formosana]|uniref:Uncharacterized protein n=1 Tax=Liquidambar formosana TaxID=63359 RepID=A0AAP0X0V8_LIQFO
MMLRKSIDKTKNFFHSTLQNLKSYLFGGYKKLPRASSFNPFSRSCSCSNLKNHQLDHFYADVSGRLESDQDKEKKTEKKSTMSAKEPMMEEDASSGSFMTFAKRSPVKIKQEEGGKEEKNIRHSHDRKVKEACSRSANGGGYLLPQKMKELEMMDEGNVEHVLDVEEVLHYYSRLRSPVYLDIVDKFFVDMYSECSRPQASVSINNSKRRLGPLKL